MRKRTIHQWCKRDLPHLMGIMSGRHRREHYGRHAMYRSLHHANRRHVHTRPGGQILRLHAVLQLQLLLPYFLLA